MQTMKRLITWISCLSMIGVIMLAQEGFAQGKPTIQEVIDVIEKVNDTWIKRGDINNKYHPGTATYHLGNLAVYRALCLGGKSSLDRCEDYFSTTLGWANKNQWGIPEKNKEADNQVVGQVYLELFELCQEEPFHKQCNTPSDSDKLRAIGKSVECTINPKGKGCPNRQYDWSWIDAIFMSGPVLSKLGDFDVLYKLYMEAKSEKYNLYDPTSKLWYRDNKSIYCPEPALSPREGSLTRCRTQNNEKSFWSRGNGWVIAAMPRILNEGPSHAAEYRQMLREMASALKMKRRQRSDGFWNPSLDDPDDFGGPETSGTALFTYAIAWGINDTKNNIFTASSKAKYEQVVFKAWGALAKLAYQTGGNLGYVQKAANEPCDWMHPDQGHPFKMACTKDERIDSHVKTLTDPYGAGAFLLAASEVAKMVDTPDEPDEDPPLLGQHVFPAADAELTGGVIIETEHEGYNGAGYANFPRSGGCMEWRAVDGGSGGDVDVAFRYALGGPDVERRAKLKVNGKEQDIIFENTGGWSVWKYLFVPVMLHATNTNTVEVCSDGDDTGNITELTRGLQAEDAMHEARDATDHKDFLGTGFVDLKRTDDDVEWQKVDGRQGGSFALTFRYALGGKDASRTVDLFVNGKFEREITFANTKSWDAWNELPVDHIQLKQGPSNTIRIETTGEDSGNLDQVFVTN